MDVMNIGNYTIKALSSGSLWLDGGAIFGIVPKVLWSKFYVPDDRNRIKVETRSLIIQGNGRTILVDTGCGNKWNDKECAMYSIDDTLLSSLQEVRLSPHDITDVILTHLHFDHTGGSTSLVDGKLCTTFPKATYYVQRKHWEWALNPTEKDRGSFRHNDFLPLAESDQLKLLDGNTELMSGIEIVLSNGHTVAQQLVKISDGLQTLLYCGDFLPYVPMLQYPYIMAYDLFPLETLKEKKKILSQAAREHWILVPVHDPTCEAITIAECEKGFTVQNKILL